MLGKKKPGFFSALLLSFIVVITASALTAREPPTGPDVIGERWQQALDQSLTATRALRCKNLKIESNPPR